MRRKPRAAAVTIEKLLTIEVLRGVSCQRDSVDGHVNLTASSRLLVYDVFRNAGVPALGKRTLGNMLAGEEQQASEDGLKAGYFCQQC